MDNDSQETMTSTPARPTIRWAEDLDDQTRQSVGRALAGCEHLVPSWCRIIDVRLPSRDLERIAEWSDLPLVALPDRAGGEITLLVRRPWQAADQRAREGSLAYWFALDVVAGLATRC